jgi:hypothetical protein
MNANFLVTCIKDGVVTSKSYYVTKMKADGAKSTWEGRGPTRTATVEAVSK